MAPVVLLTPHALACGTATAPKLDLRMCCVLCLGPLRMSTSCAKDGVRTWTLRVPTLLLWQAAAVVATEIGVQSYSRQFGMGQRPKCSPDHQ
jgi:hypothetical protein